MSMSARRERPVADPKGRGCVVAINHLELLIPYPEPATLALLSLGALGLLACRRRTP